MASAGASVYQCGAVVGAGVPAGASFGRELAKVGEASAVWPSRKRSMMRPFNAIDCGIVDYRQQFSEMLTGPAPILALAPMQDVTDLPFMNLMTAYGGADLYFT